MKNIKKIFIFAFLIIIYNVLVFSSCTYITPPLKLSEPTIDGVPQSSDNNSWNYTFKWTTVRTARSVLYYGTDPTNLSGVAESQSGEEERIVTVKELPPETTYYYRAFSEINSPDVEYISAYNPPEENPAKIFTTEVSPENNYIEGTVNYTQINQTAGNIIVEAWDSIYAFDEASSAYKRAATLSPTGGHFIIKVKNGTYKLRAFRDFDGDGRYTNDERLEAIYIHPSDITIITNNENIGIITLNEPTEEPDQIEFISPIDNVTLKSGTTTPIVIHINNQWGNSFTGTTALTFSSLNPNIVVGGSSVNATYNGPNDLNHNIMLEKTAPITAPKTRLNVIVDAFPTVTVDSSAEFTLGDNLINLHVDYIANARYEGNLIIQVSNDGGTIWNYQQITVTTSSTPPVPTTLNGIYSADFVIFVDNYDTPGYKIRGFRDYGSNNLYTDSLREAFGNAIDNATGQPTIPINNNDKNATLTIVEPPLTPSTIEVGNPSETSIKSGEIVSFNITLRDQWGNLYNQDAYYSFTPQRIDLQSLNSTDVQLVDVTNVTSGTRIDIDTIEDTDKNGTITPTVKLNKLTAGIGAKNTNIRATWNGTALTQDTLTITVGNNHITGAFSYTNNGSLQLSGNLYVELWDSTTNFNFTTGNKLETKSIAFGGVYTFDFEVPDSNVKQYYLRVYRDYPGNPPDRTVYPYSPIGYNETNQDDIIMDAYMVYGGIGTPQAILINHSDTNINSASLTFNNKIRRIHLFNISSQPSSTVVSGNSVSVGIATRDQWGTLYGGSGTETIDFRWGNPLNSNVILGTISSTLSTGGSSTLNTTLTNQNSGPNTNVIYAELTSNTSKNTTTNSISVNRNSISGTITYTQQYQTAGNIKVKAYDDGAFSIELGSTTATFIGGNSYSYTISNIPSNSTEIYILAFRDFNNDNVRDTIRDAYGVYGSNPIANVIGDKTGINFTITEPARQVGGISIATQPVSVRSGQPVTPTISSVNQWGGAFGSGSISFSWIGSNVSLTPSSGTLEADGSTDFSITPKNTNSGPNSGIIRFTANGYTVDSNNITIGLNQITGTVSYSVVSPKQPAGSSRIRVEAWRDGTFDGSDVRYDMVAAGINGTANFNYTLSNIYSDDADVYLRAFFDYNNDSTYHSDRDGVGFYPGSINMNGSDKTGMNFSINSEPPQVVTLVQITSQPSPTTIRSGESVLMSVRSRDQWNNIYGTTPFTFSLNNTYGGKLNIDSYIPDPATPVGGTLNGISLTISNTDTVNRTVQIVISCGAVTPLNSGNIIVREVIPPANVTGFNVTFDSINDEMDMSWTNPGADFAGVIIVKSDDNVFGTPVNGTTYTTSSVINDGTNNDYVQYVGSGTSYSDSVASYNIGDTVYYKIFSYDANNNYASGVVDSDMKN